MDCSSLESVTFGRGLETIGEAAFCYCYNLASIDIPDGVTSLGDGTFSYCSGLESVTLGSRVETIGDFAFYGCDNLAVIDCRAVLPPVCLTAMCFGDISNCTLSVPEGAEEAYKTADVWKEFFYEYFMRGGIKYGAQTSPQGNIAMVVAGGEYTGDITIPATVENGGITYTVTSIRGNAFSDCSDLVSVDIPAGVTSIGDYAFYYCSSLTYVDIPNGVTSIGYGAFSDCSSLVSVDIPDGVKSIGGDAFSYCSSLESVTLGSGVETIGDYAFSDCSSLAEINSLATLPPACEISCFFGVDKNACTLNVPEGTADDYRAADGWKYTQPQGA